eukprot:scaffold3036_cov117-Cylindrotheca_fusiformis.AAC.5
MTLMVPSGVAFSVGSSSNAAGDSSGKTLDEMIKDRRKEQISAKRAPRKASTSDRSIATGRAKREAAAKARRGTSQASKPNAMEIEREVYRQHRKTETAKKKSKEKASGGRLAPDSALRKKNGPNKGAASVAIFGGRMPPKKAIEAAVKGMEGAGFKVPTGHQVVMTFIPSAASGAPEKTATNAKTKPAERPKNSKEKSKGGPRRATKKRGHYRTPWLPDKKVGFWSCNC